VTLSWHLEGELSRERRGCLGEFSGARGCVCSCPGIFQEICPEGMYKGNCLRGGDNCQGNARGRNVRGKGLGKKCPDPTAVLFITGVYT